MASNNNRVLRIIPLGGVGSIGKNMTVVEYGRHMIIVDCGVMFPGADTPGVDFILPNFNYVLEHQEMLRGIILTHGHLDHIGGLPYLLQQIQTPIYGMPFTIGLVANKLHDMGLKPQLREINERETITLGTFQIDAFHVTHSIPDAVGFVIKTPAGTVVFLVASRF